MGKLWWDSFQGGQGAIYTSLDGNVDPYPWEVNNASRVVDTIVVRAGRLYSYDLSELRVHDINVVTDLNEHHPTLPVPPPTQDPSAGGSVTTIPSDGTQLPESPAFDSVWTASQNSAANHVSIYWTGWWPQCHFVVDFSPTQNSFVRMEAYVDILGQWELNTLDIQLFDDSSMTDAEINKLAQSDANRFAPYWMDLTNLGWLVNAAFVTARITAVLAEKGNVWAQVLFGISVAAFMILWVMWMIEFCHAVIESGISRQTAANLLIGMFLSVAFVTASLYAAAGRFPNVVYKALGLPATMWKDWTVSSYAIMAMIVLMTVSIFALAVAFIFSDFLPLFAAEIGYTYER